MMLLLSIFSEIPQLNFGLWFLIKSEEAGAAMPFSPYSAASHHGGGRPTGGSSHAPGATDKIQSPPDASITSVTTSAAGFNKKQEPTAATALLSSNDKSVRNQ
jgi:hypothetical protein